MTVSRWDLYTVKQVELIGLVMASKQQFSSWEWGMFELNNQNTPVLLGHIIESGQTLYVYNSKATNGTLEIMLGIFYDKRLKNAHS